MKTVLEEGFIGVDMPPLPDDIWRGVRLLQLTEIDSPAYTTSTTSETLTAWLSPPQEAVTTSGTSARYGIICGDNPVNSQDPFGLCRWTERTWWVWFRPAGAKPQLGSTEIDYVKYIGMNENGFLAALIEDYGPGAYMLAKVHDEVSRWLLEELGNGHQYPFGLVGDEDDIVIELTTIAGTIPVVLVVLVSVTVINVAETGEEGIIELGGGISDLNGQIIDSGGQIIDYGLGVIQSGGVIISW